MDISSLQAFIAVADSRSFSAASGQLFITQPAVSKRVAALETELGVSLFNRIARKISLTDAGKELLPRAKEIVAQSDDLARYASNFNQRIAGNLSIAIAHHVGLYRMPRCLKRFNQQHSEVLLDIRFQDSDQALAAVEQGDIEFAVITLPSQLPDNLKKETLWTDKLEVVVAKDHNLATQKNVRLKQLIRHDCVLPTKETETHQVIQREMDSHGLDMTVQMHSNNLETLKMLVVAGLGWSLLPNSMLDDRLHCLGTNKVFKRELGLVFHSKRTLSNAANAFLTILRDT